MANNRMDRFDAMRVFTRVVERRSFIARRRGSRPAALDRDRRRKGSWKHVSACACWSAPRGRCSPTLDGEAHYRRCLSLIADLEDAEGRVRRRQAEGLVAARGAGHAGASFPAAEPAGLFRAISGHRNQHERKRPLDRPRSAKASTACCASAHLPDSDMIARPVVMLERLTCAAPPISSATAPPTDPDDLDGHRMVGLRSLTTGRSAADGIH